MSVFDGPSASLFRQAPDGRVLFRPFGRRGGTYVVPPERAAELRAWQQRFTMFGLVVIVVAVNRWKLMALWIVPVLIALLCLKYWHFTRTLLPTDDEPVPVTRKDVFVATAQAAGLPVLAALTIGSALFFAVGVWMWVVDPGRDAYLIAIFFGLCTAVNAAQFWVAWRRS